MLLCLPFNKFLLKRTTCCLPFPDCFSYFLTPHRKSFKICEKIAHLHPYFLNRQHCWGSGSGNQYVYPCMIWSREAKGTLGRTVSPRAVSLLFQPCLRGSGCSWGHPPSLALPERRLLMQMKSVGLHVLHQSHTGDWQFIWRTIYCSQSTVAEHGVFITLTSVFSCWAQCLTAASQGQWDTSRSFSICFCTTLWYSKAALCHITTPVSPLSHHELVSPLTQILLSLTGCGTSDCLPCDLLSSFPLWPLQADMLLELISWLGGFK